MKSEQQFSIVTPASVFVSGLEHSGGISKGILATVTPLLAIGFGVVLALSGQWTAPSTLIETGTWAGRGDGWTCPLADSVALPVGDPNCGQPAISALAVKDMIAAQLSCAECG